MIIALLILIILAIVFPGAIRGLCAALAVALGAYLAFRDFGETPAMVGAAIIAGLFLVALASRRQADGGESNTDPAQKL